MSEPPSEPATTFDSARVPRPWTCSAIPEPPRFKCIGAGRGRKKGGDGVAITVQTDMAEMQGMETMLRKMLESQESLAKQVGELAQKVTRIDQKVERMGNGHNMLSPRSPE